MISGKLYPEIQTYLNQRASEIDTISPTRKSELQHLSDYVSQCISSGREANLTFVCTHNSRRSHLTQIWAQIAAVYLGLKTVHTFSGGTEATACNPRTVEALKRCGFRFSADDAINANPRYAVLFSESEPALLCYSKIFNQSPNPSSGYCAVMTCSHADENCPVAIGCDLRLPIRYDDPKVSDDTPMEAATYDERCAQIAREMFYAMSRVKV